ncbi:hypothetical protein M33023_01420 [Candidatus Phytoplasma asteris]|uniref:Uncharacterized protein n=1 Tax=Candidatus Phytoplasma asteris TaxID=85620 RepID=A0ABZ2YGH0_9MOLU
MILKVKIFFWETILGDETSNLKTEIKEVDLGLCSNILRCSVF